MPRIRTDAVRNDGEMPISTNLMQPRAEGEVAFLMHRLVHLAQ